MEGHGSEALKTAPPFEAGQEAKVIDTVEDSGEDNVEDNVAADPAASGPIEEQDKQEEPVQQLAWADFLARASAEAPPAPIAGPARAPKSDPPADQLPRPLAPMLQHYREVKVRYPEHLLLFQVGDFYEVFFEDARTVAEALQIRLTSRDKEQAEPIPMCGVPVHALDNHLPRLLKNGFSCVIVSQVEDAKEKKGMVRRDITRIVTPGVRYEGDGLEEKQFNFLAALVYGSGSAGAMAYVDVSTGNLRVREFEGVEEVRELLRSVRPAELLLPSLIFKRKVDPHERWLREAKSVAAELGTKIVSRPFAKIEKAETARAISERFPETKRSAALAEAQESLRALSPLACTALDTILSYVDEVSFSGAPALSEFNGEQHESAVFIDAATRRNLEITECRIDGDTKNSLLSCIDFTRTAMGSRRLSDWMLRPSRSMSEILSRHEAVDELLQHPELIETLRTVLAPVRDLDRLVTRINGSTAGPREVVLLGESLASLPGVGEVLHQLKGPLFGELAREFDPLCDVAERLAGALASQPPVRVSEGGIFVDGYHAELDRLRSIRNEGHLWLARLEAEERERSGISGLKVRYNNVAGYFIEVSKAHLAKVPGDYERRQTLVNAERYVTKKLKEYEQEILSAKSKQVDLERELFQELRLWICAQTGRIQTVSRLLGIIDVLAAFAYLARKQNFRKPVMSEGTELKIENGRHPVIETVIGAHNFVPNGTRLNTAGRRFAVLTGPNMGGKSTYLRQVALIQLLAQAGSFVPASHAELGVVDRIFTRIGAADDLTRGDSTFMVEMREAASIVRKATSRSLVLIDEIGRGTATTDGLAIATAIAEWLHDNVACKTIFATHFHELTGLAGVKSGAFCLSVGVVEHEREISFTHRIEEKPADRSYGIEVARLAGLPEGLLERAQAVLSQLEEGHTPIAGKMQENSVSRKDEAADAKAVSDTASKEEAAADALRPLVERIRSFAPNRMTPIEALQELAYLQELAEEALIKRH